ncbi:ComF family protein [Chloroflexota bacterium]
MLPHVAKLGGMALDLIFPQKCIGCGKEGSVICHRCQASLPRIMPPLCPLCGRPQSSGILCPDCVSWKASLDGIRSPFRFEGTAQQAVYQLKYGNLRILIESLANLLADYLAANEIPCDTLVPVPLHSKRIRERGYNQSALLAKRLGKFTGLPVVDNCLIRQLHTPPQARTANVEERRSNISGAFACRDERLKGKDVILIDDVSTSGATLDACAEALKDTGVKSVWGLTLAREI